MKKITNPYAKKHGSDFGCFGCSPTNAMGLQLEFVDYGTYIEATWKPESKFEGFTGILHGGIQATLMDEIASWLVFTKCATAGVTAGLSVEYHKPLRIADGTVIIKAWLLKIEERTAFIASEIIGTNGIRYASGEARYFLYPENIAKSRFHYPGVEHFYTE